MDQKLKKIKLKMDFMDWNTGLLFYGADSYHAHHSS